MLLLKDEYKSINQAKDKTYYIIHFLVSYYSNHYRHQFQLPKVVLIQPSPKEIVYSTRNNFIFKRVKLEYTVSKILKLIFLCTKL